MKKFLVTMLMGAFMFSALAATVGCGGDAPKDKDKKKEATPAAADKDKKKDS